MGVNQVVFGSVKIMDISDSTVTADSMMAGDVAYGADGEKVVGTFSLDSEIDTSENLVDQIQAALVGKAAGGSGGSSGSNDIARQIVDRTITEFSDDAVTVIGSHAFGNCAYLTSVNVPSVISVNEYAFAYCESLSSVCLPSVEYMASYCFAESSSLVVLSLPAVIHVDFRCFYSAFALTTIELSSVVLIGEEAFSGCYSLANVIIRTPSKVCELAGEIFDISTPIYNGEGYIYVPDDLVEAYKTADYWIDFADQILPVSQYDSQNS